MLCVTLLGTSIYAIIGGPSTGKTSVIDELKLKGKHTFKEAATIIIKQNIAKGNPHPWGQTGFQTDIFNLQIKQEEEAIKDNKQEIFVDRGILDNLVYLQLNGQENTEEYKRLHKAIFDLKVGTRYTATFYIEPHSRKSFTSEKIDTRCETTDEALKISAAIKAAYSKYYDLIIIPGNLSAKKRADLILEKISQLNTKK